MKKLLLLIICLTITNAFAASVEFGTDFGFSFDSDISKTEYESSDDTKDKDVSNSLTINPRISILTDKVELAISPRFGLQSSKGENDDGDTISTDRSMRFNYGIGFGSYFRIVKGERVRLSFGPDVSFTNYSKWNDLESDSDPEYESYSNFYLALGAPIVFDILAGEKFGLRITSDIINFTWHHYSYQREEVSEFFSNPKYSTNNFDVDFTGIISPTLGFFIRF